MRFRQAVIAEDLARKKWILPVATFALVVRKRQTCEKQFRNPKGLFKMGIAGQDKRLYPKVPVFEHSGSNGLRAPDKCGTCPATNQANARPEIRTNLQGFPAPPDSAQLLQREHALLTDRIVAGQSSLSGSYSLIAKMADKRLGVPPRSVVGFTNDDVKTDAESNGSSPAGHLFPNSFNLRCNLSRRFTPGDVMIDVLRRNCDANVRRAGKIKRRIGLLDS